MRNAVQKITKLARQAARAEDKPITLIFFAAGVVITLIQYQEFLANKRVEISYGHVEEWQEAGFKSAFERVAYQIRQLEADAAEAVPEDLEDVDLARLNAVQNRIVQISAACNTLTGPVSASGQNQFSVPCLGSDLDQLFYFFDKLHVCIDRGLCDGDLLEQFFKDNVSRLWIYTIGFVVSRREEIEGYGLLTETYVKRLETPKDTRSTWDLWTGS